MTIEEVLSIKTIRDLFGIQEDEQISEAFRSSVAKMEERHYKPGEAIVLIDATPEDGLYVIVSGVADVTNKSGKSVNTMYTGECIGELALLNNSRRNATVVAKTPVICIQISRELFEEILVENRHLVTTFLKRVYEKTAGLIQEQERLQTELKVATQIQETSLERDFSAINVLKDIEFYADMVPAKEVGGDFYDVFSQGEKLYFLIADVSGKGVGAALFMMMAKIHIRNYAQLGMSLDEVAYRTNNQLCSKNEANMFVTAFLCMLDRKENVLYFVNAGHNRPFISIKNESFHMLNSKSDLVLGLMDDVPYHTYSTPFGQGDRIYLYTDGVTEALNIDNELYSDERIEIFLNNSENKDLPQQFVESIYAELTKYSDGVPQADDITMVYLCRR